MKEYRDYITYIKNLAKEDKDVVFYNSGPKHAALVMATIFENATKYIKIYAGNFSGEISNEKEYREGLTKFLNKGGKLEILLDKKKFNPAQEPKIFDILRYYSVLNPPENISVKVHSSRVTKGEDNEVHFTVADDKMYRIEDNIQKFTAEGNFNNPPVSEVLVSIFDKISARADTETISLSN